MPDMSITPCHDHTATEWQQEAERADVLAADEVAELHALLVAEGDGAVVGDRHAVHLCDHVALREHVRRGRQRVQPVHQAARARVGHLRGAHSPAHPLGAPARLP